MSFSNTLDKAVCLAFVRILSFQVPTVLFTRESSINLERIVSCIFVLLLSHDLVEEGERHSPLVICSPFLITLGSIF